MRQEKHPSCSQGCPFPPRKGGGWGWGLDLRDDVGYNLMKGNSMTNRSSTGVGGGIHRSYNDGARGLILHVLPPTLSFCERRSYGK